MKMLLEHTILGERLAATLGCTQLEPVFVERLCVLAALHDAGKFNLGFQRRGYPGEPGKRAGHLSVIIDVFNSSDPLKLDVIAALRVGEMCAWFKQTRRLEVEEVTIGMLLTTWAHHGYPIKEGSSFDPALWSPAVIQGRVVDPLSGLNELMDAVSSWLPRAFAQGEAVHVSPAFQHLFNGILTLADWMGSDERYFTFDEGDPVQRFDWAYERARELARRNVIIPAQARASLGVRAPDFRSIHPTHTPRAMQHHCASLAPTSPGRILVLESDTGSGKTEAALAYFLRLFHAGQVDSLYFALPTRTAATQLHRRLVQVIAHAFPDESVRPPVSLAVSGYIQVDHECAQALPHFRVLWPDAHHEDAMRWRGWAAEQPRRFLAGAVVVGTIDQALLSTLSVNHAHMRYAALSRSLLVVDEVHASDAYMNALLKEVLTHHTRHGGHALLMSATLGQCALAEFAPYQPAPSLAQALERAYPLITHIDVREEEVERVPFSHDATTYQKRVIIEPLTLADPEHGPGEDVITRAIEAAQAGARVLIIRNTVRDCVSTLQAIEQALTPTQCEHLLLQCNHLSVPHHSRYASADRRLLDEAIELAFGKHSQRQGVIAVATQTVQQSLDLDADLMLTDLCPMDVLLQRLGRLHRHPNRARCAGFERARLLLMMPQQTDWSAMIAPQGHGRGPHGLGTVYEDLRMLKLTAEVLLGRGEVTIPLENRELVELALHPEALEALVMAAPDTWQAHTMCVEGDTLSSSTMAQMSILKREQDFFKSVFPGRDEIQKIRTRLGADDRLVVFEEPLPGPLGQRIESMTISAHLCAANLAEDALPQLTSTSALAISFDFGQASYVYDRYGLSRSPA